MEMLLDMWAPPIFNDDGEMLGRDYGNGVISREQALILLDTPDDPDGAG